MAATAGGVMDTGDMKVTSMAGVAADSMEADTDSMAVVVVVTPSMAAVVGTVVTAVTGKR